MQASLAAAYTGFDAQIGPSSVAAQADDSKGADDSGVALTVRSCAPNVRTTNKSAVRPKPVVIRRMLSSPFCLLLTKRFNISCYF